MHRRWWAERWRNAGLAALVLACLGCALAVWRAVVAHRDVTVAGKALAVEAIPEDHFPGAALIYAAEPPAPPKPPRPEMPAPAPGTTGSVAPLPEPVAATSLPEPVAGTIVAARPFLLGRAAALDRGRALECLSSAVYYEAGNQSDDGERAVAQVVLNRVRHPAFPATVCGVVYQGSEHAECQFSFACDGSMNRAASRAGWARAMRIAADALAGQVFAPVGLATHYHTYAVTPAWNRALVMTDVVGVHFFHRWKGYWGTPAAFRQPWSQHEPTPGPNPRLPDGVTPPSPLPAPMIAAVGAAPAAPTTSTPLASAQAAPPPSGDVSTSQSLPASQVLDKWRDSGKPLK